MTERAPDHDEIVRVVQLYVDGFNKCDVNRFKEAFDPDAARDRLGIRLEGQS